MKKVLIFLGALLLSSSANAEWTRNTSTQSSSTGKFYDTYLDFKSMRKQGSYRYVWHLSNYETPDKFGTSSATFYYEVDCQRYGIKTLSVIYHQFMAEGKAADSRSYADNEFEYPRAPSTAAFIVEQTCEH